MIHECGSRLGLVRLRQANAAECIVEMLGEMFRVGRQESSPALAALGQGNQQVQSDRVQLAVPGTPYLIFRSYAVPGTPYLIFQ